MEYIVARSSHTRLCAGVPLCSFTSYFISFTGCQERILHREILRMAVFGVLLLKEGHTETDEQRHATLSFNENRVGQWRAPWKWMRVRLRLEARSTGDRQNFNFDWTNPVCSQSTWRLLFPIRIEGEKNIEETKVC
jgi:hypothetical protein